MPSPHQHNANAVEVSALSVGYNGKALLEDLSFTIPHGAMVAILGPNGSGKSTLMKALLGLLPTLDGTILINGRPLAESYGRIGYVPQRFKVDPSFPMSVGEFLQLALPAHLPKTRIKEKLGEVGLNPVVVRHMPLSHLSGGQLQRVLLARAILRDPDVLFLDEASAGVDVAGEQAFFNLLHHQNKDHNTTVIMISHEINLVEQHVDHVLCLNRGLICSGSPETAMTDEVIKQLYGSHVDRHRHGDSTICLNS